MPPWSTGIPSLLLHHIWCHEPSDYFIYWTWNWQRYEIVNGVVEIEGITKESAAETPEEQKSGDETSAEQKGEYSFHLY
jgi:hypothetical protein